MGSRHSSKRRGRPAAGRTTAYPLGCGVFDAIQERTRTGRSSSASTRCWEVLGVARNAEPAAVKGTFRELSRLLHPDKRSWLGRKISGEKLVRADALFATAQEAYDGLETVWKSNSGALRHRRDVVPVTASARKFRIT